jgi:predicted nucleic acid-binding protein
MVVVDNNILSSLAKIDRLELLPDVFEQPGTVPSVIQELHHDDVAGYGFVAKIDEVKRYNDGWLYIRSLSEAEVALAEQIVDTSLSFTDAECIAVSEHRSDRLLTDDGHVGEIATQRGVEVWDLKLLLEAAVHKEIIETQAEIDDVTNRLREEDNYSFSEGDKTDLSSLL